MDADGERHNSTDAVVQARKMMGDRLLFTVPAAAQVLSLGKSAVWDLVARGDIKSVKIGRSRRISRDALLEFVEKLPSVA